MQIHEITWPTLKENAFMSGLTKSIGQQTMGGMNTAGSGMQAVSAAAAQGKAAEISQPAVAALAKNQQLLWTRAVQDLMTQTVNSGTGKAGVISIADVPRTELERALDSQVNANLARMSGRNLTDFRDLPREVDPASFDGKAVQLATQFVRDIEQALGAILATEPTKANDQKLAGLWMTLSQRLYQAANMAEFQKGGATTAAQPGKNAQQTQMMQAAQKSGLTSKSLGINYKVTPTTNPQFNALMQAMGFMDAPRT